MMLVVQMAAGLQTFLWLQRENKLYADTGTVIQTKTL
jgi:hypothetical protein